MLIFPEGERHATGAMDAFRPGVGMIGARLDVPVVPVRLEGLDKVLHPQMEMAEARPGACRVRRAAAAQRGRLRSAGEAGRRRGQSARDQALGAGHQALAWVPCSALPGGPGLSLRLSAMLVPLKGQQI